MGTGSFRSMVHDGAPILRGAAALALCAFLLSGCANINELKEKVWPFDSNQAGEDGTAASEGGDETVTAEAGEEIALEPALVAKVQKKLTELGYEPGPVDGLMGTKTRAAIRRYQVVVGLPVDGRITRSVLARLTGSADTAGPANADGEAEAGPATAEGMALGPAPAYAVGDRYVYADGDVRTVLSVDGDKVYWQSNKNGHSVVDSNFLVPSLSWVSSETSGKRTLNDATADLWPHDSHAEIAFSTTAMVEHKTRPDSGTMLNESWRCRVEGERQLSVRAGDFQTRQITCDGRAEPDGTSVQRIWHYAPEIRHYVLYEEIDQSRQLTQRSELLAIVPSTVEWPPVARAGLGWALEHALETAAPGERTTWTSSAAEIEVTIVPGQPAAGGDGDAETCRNFVQIWSQPGNERVYPGLTCRQPTGRWQVPGLDAGVALAKGAE